MTIYLPHQPAELEALKADLTHIKGKVNLLNDWHNEVNRRFDVFDEKLRWVLRISGLALLLSVGEKGLPYLIKIFGG